MSQSIEYPMGGPAPALEGGAVAAPSQLIQCQPILQRDPTNVWSKLEAARERIYTALQQACRAEGIECFVGRNNSFEYPAFTWFECWLPTPGSSDSELTERVWARITINPKPYHKFELEYAVEVHNRGRDKKWGVFGALTDSDVRAIVAHLVHQRSKPKLSLRLRQSNDSLIRLLDSKRNKPVGLRRSYVGMILQAMIVLAVLLVLVLGYLQKEESGLMVLSGLFFGSGFAVIIAASVIYSRQRVAVRSAGKSDKEPRTLLLYDFWQVVVFGAGASREILRDRFLNVLQGAPISGLSFAIERLQYLGLDRLEERDQIVLTAGRGIIYCQIYQFGADLYIGWQSFLNRGKWVEQKLERGIDRDSNQRVELRTVVPGTQAPSEYDWMDLNCLMEWTHAEITSLTRQLLKELQIDQEIDFKIVRSERRLETEAAGQPEKRRDIFRRTA
jgi:hypothetical protein